MSVTNDDKNNGRIQYFGNNSTSSAYTVPFYFFANDDLLVQLTEPDGSISTLSQNTDYTVAGADNENGGSITTIIAYDNIHKITISRVITADQTMSYGENDKFPAESHERALDKLTMLVQQALRASDRSVHVGDTDGKLSPFVASANTFLGLDEDKNPKTYTVQDLLSFISLPTPILNFPTKTFADSGERALAVPDFVGQFGSQRDTKAIYFSTGTSAGNWTLFSLVAGNVGAIITAAMLSNTQTDLIAILDKISKQGSDIASASTINLDTATGDLVDVTGTTTIIAITLSQGKSRTVRFTGTLTLTNGSSLVLPGGANITTAAGDCAVFRG